LPRPLILEWFPATEVGVECHREHSTGRHPPLNRLHVWWARRPLVLSAAAVLSSLLPADAEGYFASAAAYRAWFLRLLGITGDPVGTLARLRASGGKRLGSDPYGYPRAFSRHPPEEDLALLRELVSRAWGSDEVLVVDPMAGGGSIPFCAVRYGLATRANELNPVACVILRASLEYPARFGPELATAIERWGETWAEEVRRELESYYPCPDVHAYLWARTVRCPGTGRPVPLSPNWWLRRGARPLAARLLPDGRFEVVAEESGPGTVARGVARSPWTGERIDGAYLKREACAGRMGQQLYALVLKRGGKLQFVAPPEQEAAAAELAERELDRRLAAGELDLPLEEVPAGHKTAEPLRYGMTRWAHFFSPRQLLAMGVALGALRRLTAQLAGEEGGAVATYLALALDKALDYNSRMARWHSGRGVVVGTFDRHDFSFKWSHAEIDVARRLLPWAVSQVATAYRELAELVPRGSRSTVSHGDAACLTAVGDAAAHLVCVDPPYFDNVMYAELSDFHYVWLRRSLGEVYPELFTGSLTDKQREAVANPSRAGSGRQAAEHYRERITACFREARRVLRPGGVLTVMFTHRRLAAWAALAEALAAAGFGVRAAWPVRTESVHSLHQAGKQAAATTVMLACASGEAATPLPREEVCRRIREAARSAGEGFGRERAAVLDRRVAAFAAVLKVLSECRAAPGGGAIPDPLEALRMAEQEIGGGTE